MDAFGGAIFIAAISVTSLLVTPEAETTTVVIFAIGLGNNINDLGESTCVFHAKEEPPNFNTYIINPVKTKNPQVL